MLCGNFSYNISILSNHSNDMIRKGSVFLVVFFGVMIAHVPVTRAASVSEVVARMDEIISQMKSLRSEFDSLTKLVPATASPASGTVLGASTSKRLTMNVALGETNAAVGLVQKLLATDSEIYPYGVVSNFFGPKTKEAIRNLQTRFDLDPVGVVGPATTALLESFFTAYPDDNFPSDALAKRPQVLGASTSVTTPPSTSVVPTGSIASITADFKQETAVVQIKYVNGNTKKLVVDGEDKDEIAAEIAKATKLSKATVLATLIFNDLGASRTSSTDNDEYDAEDAIDDADLAIRDAQDEIDDADDDGDDIDWADETLDEAKDKLRRAEAYYDDEEWDRSVEYSVEAENLALDAIDRIDERKR